MLRPLLTTTSVVVSLVALALAWSQHRELASLHEDELRTRTKRSQAILHSSPNEVIAVTVEQHTPSLELLRLRGEIGLLERRKRELGSVHAENERLRTQLATKGTNAPTGIALPPGYLRKTEAKFVGYNTPEDTVQSMLWAIQNRDAPGFMQAFNPEMAKQFADRISRSGSADEFFKEADVLPGFHIIDKAPGADGTMVLTVEILPGDTAHSEKLTFKQLDGRWKLTSGL
jgi:hypothetical protein